MNHIEAKLAITNKVNQVIALARNEFDAYIQPTPAIKFTLRGRSCGGTALGSRELNFNLDWYSADPERFLAIVVPHEVAHIVTSAIAPYASAHGREWRSICIRLGGDGLRTCNLPSTAANGTVKRARQTFEYCYTTDIGNESWIGATHHKRLQERGGLHPILGKHMYALRSPHGRIVKEGFAGKRRARV